MIQPGTLVKVLDNTLVKEIKCIKVLIKGKHPVATQGDIIIGSIKKIGVTRQSDLRSQKHLMGSKGSGKLKGPQWKRGDLVKAVVCRTKKQVDRSRGCGRGSNSSTGIKVAFPSENSCILLGSNGQDPLASRAKGPISSAIRSKGFTKVLSLGSTLV
mmetsp:Transcript_12288/g.15253  ORF Transcript_12288/g.15253 Transcript_12288/m.15253 type:complete len:157 (+) Transcript_12288:166-636(+)